MLVFASDLHLTDGTSGQTIGPKAFEVFTHHLAYLAGKAKAKVIDVVFLGDILDPIRSGTWLKTCIRPWSAEDETDGSGHDLRHYVERIVSDICEEGGGCRKNKNVEASRFLADFKTRMAAGTPATNVRYHYYPGNHDWLINRYPTTRKMAATFLHLERPGQYASEDCRLPTERVWPRYRVAARHGDIHDPLNFDGDRDASSLGDAIVIDLVNRFPDAVKNRIGARTDPALISKLKDIDNVRPLTDIPKWVQGACIGAPERTRKQVKDEWNRLVDEFLAIDFVKSHDRWFLPDAVDALQAALRISKWFSISRLADMSFGRFLSNSDNYAADAYDEAVRQYDWCRFVVYGHSHKHAIIPLDHVVAAGERIEKMYINTGTWRPVHKRVAYNTRNFEFSCWQVMTFVAFYLPGERYDRRFEVWSGALG